ncbi:hypothetical protein SUGI_0942920 [Cryptomeria japonica]|nr:hypothetical protein SUGI_0942920 [Cryptomeria japonica]
MQDSEVNGDEDYDNIDSPLENHTLASGIEPIISKFLKLLVHTITTKPTKEGDNGIRLNRQSQLLTTNYYMKMLMEQEKRKKEIEEIKIQKKQKIEENKTTWLVARELKEQAKIYKEIKLKEKEKLREQQKKDKEAKKEQ